MLKIPGVTNLTAPAKYQQRINDISHLIPTLPPDFSPPDIIPSFKVHTGDTSQGSRDNYDQLTTWVQFKHPQEKAPEPQGVLLHDSEHAKANETVCSSLHS